MKTATFLFFLLSASLIHVQAYHFTPVTDPYYGNMNVIAQVQDKNGNVITNCELGAFAGAECRATDVVTSSLNLIFLTIAGEDGRNDIISFKIYDPVSNQEIDAVGYTIPYQNDRLIGTLKEPYIIKTSLIITGNDKITNEEFAIFPTLVTDKIYIRSGAKLNQITITNLTGKILLRENNPSVQNTLDVSILPPGIYFVTAINEQGRRNTKRIIKK